MISFCCVIFVNYIPPYIIFIIHNTYIQLCIFQNIDYLYYLLILCYGSLKTRSERNSISFYEFPFTLKDKWIEDRYLHLRKNNSSFCILK